MPLVLQCRNCNAIVGDSLARAGAKMIFHSCAYAVRSPRAANRSRAAADAARRLLDHRSRHAVSDTASPRRPSLRRTSGRRR